MSDRKIIIAQCRYHYGD
ncbi:MULTISPECIES: hypothetical protein [Methylobacter]